MIWFHAIFALVLVGLLSPVTANSKNSSSEARVESGLVSETQKKRGESPCLEKECTAPLDFSEPRRYVNETQPQENMKISGSQGRRFLDVIMALSVDQGRRKMSDDDNDEDGDRSSTSDFTVPLRPQKGPHKKDFEEVHEGGMSSDSEAPNSLKSALGVVIINRVGKGPVCSGVLLKPWVVATTADCVYGLPSNILSVTVTMGKNSHGVHPKVYVLVESSHIAPGYSRGKPAHNFALLVLYAQENWDVWEFKFSKRPYTNKELAKKHGTTFVDVWSKADEVYYASTIKVGVMRTLGACGLKDTDTDWYCVKRTEKHPTYSNIDIGSPFFYGTGPNKHLLGMYTGRKLGQRARGELYQSFAPERKWIMDFLRRHNTPPSPP